MTFVSLDCDILLQSFNFVVLCFASSRQAEVVELY